MRSTLRLRLRCRGTVQGVGFRPWIYRMALELALGGFVLNDPDGVLIEIEASRQKLDIFLHRLKTELPPLARLDTLDILEIEAGGSDRFEVRSSGEGLRFGSLVPPDAALCSRCRAEMDTPGNRRHRYAFCSCASCGPRFSLTRSLPYDRQRTTMAVFDLCPECLREYEDPADRRFHTEAICCPACGPRLRFEGEQEISGEEEALEAAAALLCSGGILALKGLGGFQLACRADSSEAVGKLRLRKKRPSKAFALMVRNLECARRLVSLSAADEELMLSYRAPIILAPEKKPPILSSEIAPGLGELGVMLPTTSLHLELFRNGAPDYLVMTSGNLSDEPIATANREAAGRLKFLADAFLFHDRDIARRIDDSVCRSTARGPMLVRRSRGWVPESLPLPVQTGEAMLALGAHLQNTVCIAMEGQAWPSQHIGDLENQSSRDFLREVAFGMEDFLEIEALHLLCDLHPDYASSWLASELAEKRGGTLHRFQHHLAHIGATLGEHEAFPDPGEKILGIAFDGTGLGSDGKAWGGEWLDISGDLGWRRSGSLEALPLIGGDKAVRRPWRIAVAVLESRGAGDLLEGLPLIPQVDPELLAALRDLVRRHALHNAEKGGPGTNPAWPTASGAGRLFEAAGAMLGLCPENRFEGEAAVRLEALASTASAVEVWPELQSGDLCLPGGALLEAVARRVSAGETKARIARGFHRTFVDLLFKLSLRLLPEGVNTIALGGGVWINRLLLEESIERFESRGLRVLFPRRLPPGDGGISYGQTVLASLEIRQRQQWREEKGIS